MLSNCSRSRKTFRAFAPTYSSISRPALAWPHQASQPHHFKGSLFLLPMHVQIIINFVSGLPIVRWPGQACHRRRAMCCCPRYPRRFTQTYEGKRASKIVIATPQNRFSCIRCNVQKIVQNAWIEPCNVTRSYQLQVQCHIAVVPSLIRH